VAFGGREVAGGMYQRSPALERAEGRLFMDFVTPESAQSSLSPLIWPQPPPPPALLEDRAASGLAVGAQGEVQRLTPNPGPAFRGTATRATSASAAQVLRWLLPVARAALALEHLDGPPRARVEKASHHGRWPSIRLHVMDSRNDRGVRRSSVLVHRSWPRAPSLPIPVNYGERCIAHALLPSVKDRNAQLTQIE
jgi:hypothetical protein